MLPLRFSFQDIVVVAKSMSGVRIGKEKFVEDRGKSIVYLLMLEDVLKSLGVKSVRLRPHPSESFALV